MDVKDQNLLCKSLGKIKLEQNSRLEAEGTGNRCSLVLLTWSQKRLHTVSKALGMC